MLRYFILFFILGGLLSAQAYDQISQHDVEALVKATKSTDPLVLAMEQFYDSLISGQGDGGIEDFFNQATPIQQFAILYYFPTNQLTGPNSLLAAGVYSSLVEALPPSGQAAWNKLRQNSPNWQGDLKVVGSTKILENAGK